MSENLSEKALSLHKKYRGKLQTAFKVPVKSLEDFAIWYTPGVAAVSKAIKGQPENSYTYTNRGNTIAVVSDGTRILGLGNIGPEAGLPVMEGKALLFKYLGGVDAVPLCINAREIEEIVTFCKWISPSFGGINIEDIESPKCFYLLERLKKEIEIPVFHDDQQGTAVIVLAALKNALKIVGKDISEVKIAVIGMGAANTANLNFIIDAGVKPENVIACDINGILNRDRTNDFPPEDPRHRFTLITNPENRKGDIKEALKDTDVCIAFSRPGPDTIKPDWIKDMNRDPIIFACANPVPEIWPKDAKEAGARVVATGRSDFPNQVNNSLGFPAIFRGALEVKAKKITTEMCVAAADAIANYAEKNGLTENYIVPRMDEEEVYIEEAIAVAETAIKQKIAREPLEGEILRKRIEQHIKEGKMAFVPQL